MSYSEARESEQLRILEKPIRDFIARYRTNPAPPDKRKTLILLPGGMGSRLRRANKKYDDNLGLPPGIKYKTIWLNAGTFLGDALKIEMTTDPQGQHRDHKNKMIVAAGRVKLFGITPYERFLDWCDRQRLDWFVYGYDWRLPMDNLAGFFLQKFLPFFKQQVMDAGCPDPLDGVVLVGHSFGGMVIKLALDRKHPLLDDMSAAITVGTPFYGYGGQMHRWCEGHEWFNHLGVREVVRTISSLPGCYALCYMDHCTYTTYRQALEDDPQFPLTAYPSVDKNQPNTIADPYTPDPGRYPVDLGFRQDFLDAGKLIYRAVAQPLPASVAPKFYNIRGVSGGGGKNSEGGDLWGIAPTPYNPPADSPLEYDPTKRAVGDAVQPGWSTRLVTQPLDHCITVQADEEHMFLMETDAVQAAIEKILGLPPLLLMMRHMAEEEEGDDDSEEAAEMVKRAAKSDVGPAAASAAYDFLQEINRLRHVGGRRAVDAFIRNLNSRDRKAFAKRFLMDMLKGKLSASPSPVEKAKDLGAEPEKPKPTGPGQKTTQ